MNIILNKKKKQRKKESTKERKGVERDTRQKERETDGEKGKLRRKEERKISFLTSWLGEAGC